LPWKPSVLFKARRLPLLALC